MDLQKLIRERLLLPDNHTWLPRRWALTMVNTFVGKALPFSRRTRFRVMEIKRGYIKCHIPLRRNHNHVGTLYAGAQFTLAELPGGILALFHFDKHYYPILKSMTVDYLKPATSDLTVEFSLNDEEIQRIEKEAHTSGKCDYTLHGKLMDRQGQVVAKSTGYYQLRSKSR